MGPDHRGDAQLVEITPPIAPRLLGQEMFGIGLPEKNCGGRGRTAIGIRRGALVR